MKQTVRLRNQTFTTWGWKYPRASIYLKALHPRLRNPKYVVVFRDPVPGGVRSSGGNDNGENYISAVLMLGLQNLRLIEAFKAPTLLVSYEKASQNPEVFLKELSDFTKISLPKDTSKLLEFMTSGSYKPPI